MGEVIALLPDVLTDGLLGRKKPIMYKVGLPLFVEVETHSYCNRSCHWCPNGWSDRGKQRDHISEGAWQAILGDLETAEYGGWFAFHNYNEPLSDPTIFDKIDQARRRLPQARLTLFTNGDYLTREGLRRLVTHGVDYLRVTLYPESASTFDSPRIEKIASYLRKLDLATTNVTLEAQHHLEGHLQVDTMELHLIVPQIAVYGNRGGSVLLEGLAKPGHRRTEPCYLPYRSVAVDHHGNLKLCCEIYDTQAPENHVYVIGNVEQDGLLDLWFSEKMNLLRKQVAAANFEHLPACQACTHRIKPERLEELPRIDDPGGL